MAVDFYIAADIQDNRLFVVCDYNGPVIMADNALGLMQVARARGAHVYRLSPDCRLATLAVVNEEAEEAQGRARREFRLPRRWQWLLMAYVALIHVRGLEATRRAPTDEHSDRP